MRAVWLVVARRPQSRVGFSVCAPATILEGEVLYRSVHWNQLVRKLRDSL